jgi:hypothetical protein
LHSLIAGEPDAQWDETRYSRLLAGRKKSSGEFQTALEKPDWVWPPNESIMEHVNEVRFQLLGWWMVDGGWWMVDGGW